MADVQPSKKKPRVRKTAPTVRERVAAAQAEAQRPQKPKRLRVVAGKAARPVKKLKPNVHVTLPDNGFGRVIGKIGRVLRRIAGWLVPRYFINSWREVRQVTWPARRETWRLTLAVFIFSTVFGAMVYGVDKGLDEIFKKFILK